MASTVAPTTSPGVQQTTTPAGPKVTVGSTPAQQGRSTYDAPLPAPEGTNAPVSPDQPDPAAIGGTGAYARVLLPPSLSSSIEIQLLEQDTAAPDSTALDYVANMLHKVSGKPVSISAPIAIPGGSQQWTGAELNAIADRYGTTNVRGHSTAVLHWIFVHGQIGKGVLGTATRGDVESIFVDESNGISIDHERVLTAIYTHETGHLLGLVDEVLHEGRADPNDPNQPSAHSPDRNSVMYYQIDTTGGILSLMSGNTNGVPVDFDAADYQDLARIRAGA